jgi:hypothetical protein
LVLKVDGGEGKWGVGAGEKKKTNKTLSFSCFAKKFSEKRVVSPHSKRRRGSNHM